MYFENDGKAFEIVKRDQATKMFPLFLSFDEASGGF